MEAETLNRPLPSGFATVPRAVWVGGGVLCLAVAALAGALVTKSIDPPRPTVAMATEAPRSNTATAPAGMPVAVQQDEIAPPSRSAAPTPDAAPGVAKPVPLLREGGVHAAAPSKSAAPIVAKPALAPCVNCGTVESVQAVKVKGEGTGVGAVAGGVLGGVVGNRFGHGNGRAAMTVLGAVGGGFAGNEVERRTRSENLFDVRIRMRDGSHRVLREAQAPAVGTRVVVEGNRLRALNG